jgi:hypothetical protein
MDLFNRSEVGNIPVGDLDGRVLHFAVGMTPKVKVWNANLAWRGKYFGPDNCALNRWIGNRRWIGVAYGIGSSWFDGRPAIVLDYPPDAPLFGSMHDEIREIAPGLYLGAVFDTIPCRRFRCWFAIEVPKC